MPQINLFILTAIATETRAIAAVFNQRFVSANHPLHFTHNHHAISLHTIGIGAIRLPDLPDPPPDAIILAGLAGALDPELAIGDILIDTSSTWPTRPLPYPRRPIHSSNRLISSTADKSTLFIQTSAAAVEMEFAKVARLANQHHTPLLHLRAISDTANQPIDPAILKCVDAYGQPQFTQIIKSLRRPSIMPELYRLFRTSRIALKSLSDAMGTILSSPT